VSSPVVPTATLVDSIPNFGNELAAAICSKSSRLSDLDGNMFVKKKLVKNNKLQDLHETKKMCKIKDELIDLYLSVKIRKNEEIDEYNSN
jgi:hypothetical protein